MRSVCTQLRQPPASNVAYKYAATVAAASTGQITAPTVVGHACQDQRRLQQQLSKAENNK